MSGHSKWATTKRKKEAVDAKRSSLFTKLANVISIAARDGGDPTMNFKLRIAIDKAKTMSMPKDNIERAIKRGAGELGGNQIEEIVYEGFGPDGIALVIEVVTDNRNRTSSEVKHILSKHGGNLGGPGTTMWMFEKKGVITLDKESLTEAEELSLIDLGIEDINQDGGITIYCPLDQFEEIKTKIENLNLPIMESGLEYVAKDQVAPPDEEKLIKLFEALDENDDVANFYSNANL